MSDSYLIHFDNVNLSYYFKSNKNLILKDIDLKIFPKDYIFFLGKNGSGKSTLLKSIFNDELIQSGKVHKNLNMFDEKKVAYVPQTQNINYELPILVEEFVELGKMNSYSQIKVIDALDQVSMADFLKTPLYALSGGQKQRVLLAKAFIRDANFLILDEPCNALDVESKEEIFQLISNFSKNKDMTKVIVSHDMNVAIKYASKVVFFSDQQIFHSKIDQDLKNKTMEFMKLETSFFRSLKNA